MCMYISTYVHVYVCVYYSICMNVHVHVLCLFRSVPEYGSVVSSSIS